MTAANSEKPAERIESINNGLPEGWKNVPLSDVGTITTGNTPPRKEPSNFGGTFPWVKPSDLDQFDPITKTQEYLSEKGAKKARLLPAETTMVSCIGNLGKVGFAGTILATNQQINSITFYDGLVDGRYGFFYCKILKGWLEDHASATTLSIINKQRFSEAPFLLPPLAEQKLIVAKVEELLARVNAARERLAKAKEMLKRFRQSVLAAACSGRLTQDWRELLKRLISKKDKTDTLPIEYKEADLLSNDLPDTWVQVRMKNVVGGIKYGTSKKCDYDDTKLPVLRIPNVIKGYIDLSDIKYAQLSPKEYEPLRLRKDDILMVRSNGSVALVGKTALVTEEENDYAYAGYLIRLRFNTEMILPSYINLALATYETRLQIEMPARSTSGVHNINSEEIGNLEIPLPPFEEQREIVCRARALFRLADEIKKRVDAAKMRVEKLTQAILAKVFRGELVPTEAELARLEGRSYEPASALLAKIKAQRKDVKPHRKRGRALQRRNNISVLTS